MGYVTPVLSFELAGQVRIAGSTSLAVGFNLALEHAPDDLMTVPIDNAILQDGSNGVAPLATPAYQMAAGTQVYLGPFIGFQFGP